MNYKFQPTLPARGATGSTTTALATTSYFNPRSPHGERRARTPGVRRSRKISTHAPRTGSDTLARDEVIDCFAFQPTLPARGATDERGGGMAKRGISTHAPRTGSDRGHPTLHGVSGHFNPRSPHGERLLP